ncbi:MAG: 4-hydroxy-tetrahydrodipicolinate synthase [Proteobacteria bacterium]|nr:4-hydroxy-tetrahydrodipicolinate synthase [Pseudomonadota bacterium]
MEIRGAMVALVTPFRNDRIDRAAVKKLIDYMIENGIDAIIPCGTTGESATLSHEEHDEMIEITLELTAGRVPVIAGTGSNSTREAVRLTKHAAQAGAQAALLITPYYNRPTQEGLYQHFLAISEASDLPLVLYNVPGRTGVNLLPPTVARLAEHKNIIGIKEASGSLPQAMEILTLCPPKFLLLSGEDMLNLPLYAIGAQGTISVIANVAPQLVSGLYDAFIAGKLKEADFLNRNLFELNRILFVETNPIPAKAALAMMGMIGPEIRLPLTEPSAENKNKIRGVLKDLGLLS